MEGVELNAMPTEHTFVRKTSSRTISNTHTVEEEVQTLIEN